MKVYVLCDEYHSNDEIIKEVIKVYRTEEQAIKGRDEEAKKRTEDGEYEYYEREELFGEQRDRKFLTTLTEDDEDEYIDGLIMHYYVLDIYETELE